jgi:hypothetical protein
MTYCCGILVRWTVMIADTAPTPARQHFTPASCIFERPGERVLMLAASGNLSDAGRRTDRRRISIPRAVPSGHYAEHGMPRSSSGAVRLRAPDGNAEGKQRRRASV